MKSIGQITLALAAAVILVGGAGISASLAHEEDHADEGTVIRVGPETRPDDASAPQPGERNLRQPMRRPGLMQPRMQPGEFLEFGRRRPPASPYYIGIAAEKVSDQLRAHVDLDDQVGLVVLQVFDGSPAAEAGIEQHDILVAADGEGLQELADLIRVVKDHAGDNMTQFTLDVIRRGQPQTVWITPSKRPEADQIVQPGFDEPLGNPGGLNFGGVRPGMLGLPGFNLNRMPGNVSVQVERRDGQPTRITVQRGDEKWEVDGDDPESLNELPEDLRPMVEGMLGGQQGMRPMPPMQFGAPGELQERLQKMEEQMRQMQDQMRGNEAMR